MEKKINIAELLKDCPRDMELDCVMYEDCKFLDVETNNGSYLIRITTPCGIKYFNKYGCYTTDDNAKCVIFPKGKTTWEEFQRPFRDGDILSYQCEGFKDRSIYIYMYHNRMNTTYYVALSGHSLEFLTNNTKGCALNGYNDTVRFATEEEKERLFNAIKDNGYKWNPETKTLERLPKFKVGDRIKKEEKFATIIRVHKNCYDVRYDSGIGSFTINLQDEWELDPNKFDINTLKPFDKVLVRNSSLDKWHIQFFERYDASSRYPFVCLCGNKYGECIPYEGNEHLLNTAYNCNDYYKTW